MIKKCAPLKAVDQILFPGNLSTLQILFAGLACYNIGESTQ